VTFLNLPYTTRTGLKIGSQYMPPVKARMTAEDEFWQGILLGIKPKSHLPMLVYIASILLLIKLLLETK